MRSLRDALCLRVTNRSRETTMYIPPHFAETRPEEIRRLIESHPLGSLVTHGVQGLDANQIPFELAEMNGESGLLRAHVARANPIWTEVENGSDVLVIFRAEHAYVSPNWYPSKQVTHRLVPTWNYQVVNIYGKIRFTEDEKFLRAVVGRLTRAHEAKAEGEKAWRMADAPADFMSAMLGQIIGVEIEFTRIAAKSKLSQNREDADRLNAADELGSRSMAELSKAMKGV